MEIKTRDFGVINIEEKEIINFPDGLPGFVEEKKYVLLPLGEDSPFIIMQSVEEKDLAFILMNPWDVVKDYEFEIGDKIEEVLKIESTENLLVFVIASIQDSIQNMTVNLAAPLIINNREKLGRQVILDDYPLRHPVQTGDKEQVKK